MPRRAHRVTPRVARSTSHPVGLSLDLSPPSRNSNSQHFGGADFLKQHLSSAVAQQRDLGQVPKPLRASVCPSVKYSFTAWVCHIKLTPAWKALRTVLTKVSRPLALLPHLHPELQQRKLLGGCCLQGKAQTPWPSFRSLHEVSTCSAPLSPSLANSLGFTLGNLQLPVQLL